MADTTPNNRPNQAQSFTVSPKGRLRGSLDRRDRVDYFTFDLNRISKVKLQLKGMGRGDNFDLELRDSRNRVIKGSKKRGNKNELINQSLVAGTYFVRVQWKAGSGNYRLIAKTKNPPDRAGDTLQTARRITVGAGTSEFSDFVGNGDENDYYTFTLSGAPSFNLKFGTTGVKGEPLQGDTRYTLLTSSGTSLENGSGNNDFSFDGFVAAGTYILRVNTLAAAADYTLQISATGVPDTAGNSNANARNLGGLASPININEFVGRGDTTDFYSFTLTHPSSDFTLAVGPRPNDTLSGTLKYTLRDSLGNTVASDSAIFASEGTSSFNEVLGAGTYFLEVAPFSSSEEGVLYNVQLSATTIPDLAGNTIPSARNIGTLTATPATYTDFVGEGDAIDVYRFELSNLSNNLQATVSGLGFDPLNEFTRVRLRNSIGDEITASTSFDNAITIARNGLGAGTYYLEVSRGFDSGNRIDYELDVLAVSA